MTPFPLGDVAGRRRSPRHWPNLRLAIVELDARLRRAEGIIEFDSSAECVLRIARGRADARTRLVDAVIERGAAVVDLHYFNEHLPSPSKTGLRWGADLRRGLVGSMRRLAVALEADPRLADVEAVRATIASSSRRHGDGVGDFAGLFGFEVLPAQRTFAQRAHHLAEDVWLMALAWAYSPTSLPRHDFRRRRDDVWISRARFLARFGARRR